MRDEIRGRGHDLRDARLVVRAEQRRAVRRDELVADVVLELRRLGRADHLPGVAERDVAALVADALRLDVRSAALARRVDVREERDRRHLAVDRRRQRRRHVAVLVDRRVREAELLQLVDKEAQQVELLRRARIALRVLVGLRVDADVAEEALGGVLGELGGERLVRVGGHRRSVRSASSSVLRHGPPRRAPARIRRRRAARTSRPCAARRRLEARRAVGLFFGGGLSVLPASSARVGLRPPRGHCVDGDRARLPVGDSVRRHERRPAHRAHPPLRRRPRHALHGRGRTRGRARRSGGRGAVARRARGGGVAVPARRAHLAGRRTDPRHARDPRGRARRARRSSSARRRSSR